MSVADFWPGFCKGTSPSFGSDCGTGSLAIQVLQDLGLPVVGHAGGPLKNLDIKHMDAEQVIKLSLLDGAVDSGSIYEMIVNEDGNIEFIEVGVGDGLASCNVYHQIQSTTYKEECTGVMVTGGKPLPERKVADWKPIWGASKEIFNCGWMSGCGLSERFSQYAIIAFRDPHLVTGNSHEDGIDSLYETLSYWEQILGYARYIEWPDSDNSPDTTVERANKSAIPILVSGEENSNDYTADLGVLQARPDKANVRATFDPESTIPKGQGIKIPIPDSFRYSNVRGTQLDMLIGVTSVMLVGRKVDTVMGIPASDEDALAEAGEANIMLGINAQADSVYKLKEGEHYILVYEEGEVSIVFADNARAFDPATFGTGVDVEISRDCAFYSSGNQSMTGVSVLPTGGTDGYLVKQIVAIVDLQIPCVKIYDPRPGKALEIAEGLEYNLAALVSIEPPAPVAFNGSLIDMGVMEKDHDPTTEQDFSDTDYERAIDQMSGCGLAVTLSFLDEAECISASSILYAHLNSGTGTVTTYVCGPDSTPQLGGHGADSTTVVNDIVYSYSDSNSYTISVSTGPKLLGDLANITNGATMKGTENVPSSGRVIEDMGDHVHFKVLLDGCGISPMIAINTAPKVIRVGDRVQCTVHNNPVEQ